MTEIDISSYEIEHTPPSARRTSMADVVLDALARNDFSHRIIVGVLQRYDARGARKEARKLERDTTVHSAVDYLMALASLYEPTPENVSASISAASYNYDGKEGYIIHFGRRVLQQKHDMHSTQGHEASLSAENAEFTTTLFRGEDPYFYHQGRPVCFAHQGTMVKLEQMTAALREVVLPPADELG